MFERFLCTVCIIVLSVACISTDGIKLPSFIQKCGRQNADFHLCMMNAWNVLTEKYEDMPVEFDLPKVYPYFIERIAFTNGGQNKDFVIKAAYKNAQVYGLENTNFTEINGTIEKGLRAKSHISRVNIIASFETDSKLLLLQLKTTGRCNVTVTDIKMDSLVHFEKYVKMSDGEEYIKIKSAKLKMIPTQIHTKINANPDDLNPQLTTMLETVLNDNSLALWDEFYPFLVKTLTEILIENYNRILKQIPVKDLFLN